MKKIAILRILLVLALLVVPVVIFAQSPDLRLGPPDVGLPGAPDADLKGTIQKVIMQILLPLAGLIAVLFLIIGGFQYMFAGANPELAKKGKETLKNAIVGLIVVILSYVIITIVVTTLMKIR